MQSLTEASEAFIGAIDQLKSSSNSEDAQDTDRLYLYSLQPS